MKAKRARDVILLANKSKLVAKAQVKAINAQRKIDLAQGSTFNTTYNIVLLLNNDFKLFHFSIAQQRSVANPGAGQGIGKSRQARKMREAAAQEGPVNLKVNKVKTVKHGSGLL